MSVATTLTFKQVPPHRPDEADILNGVKENRPPGAAVPPDVPAAEEYMQIARQVVALARMAPLLRVGVVWSGSTPLAQSLACIRDDVLLGDLTVSVVSSKVRVAWPADKFPGPQSPPMVTLNSSSTARVVSATIGTNYVDVAVLDGSGTAVHEPFTVEIF